MPDVKRNQSGNAVGPKPGTLGLPDRRLQEHDVLLMVILLDWAALLCQRKTHLKNQPNIKAGMRKVQEMGFKSLVNPLFPQRVRFSPLSNLQRHPHSSDVSTGEACHCRWSGG